MSNQNKEHKFLRFLSFGIVFSFFSFMSFKVFFPASPSSADTSASIAATLELEIEPTIEMALSTDTLNLSYDDSTDILPTSEGVTATGSIDVYVTTNSLSGYDLRMYSSSGTTSMTNINSAVSASIAPTTGGSTLSNNTWGYQSNYVPGSWVAVGDGADNAKPLTNPTSSPNATLCDLTDIAHCESNSYDTTTVTFGAKITDSLPAGRYTNDVVFTAIAKVPYVKTAYTIAYNKNSQDASGTVPSSIAVHPGGAVTFSNGSTLTPPEGKVLAGWALKADGSYPSTLYTSETTGLTIEDLIEDAIIAGQNVSENQPGTITLYAIYENDIVYMQNWTGCSTLSTNDYAELVDSRDNKTYTVKKLPDGKCWMMQNLTINGTELTPDDTNIADGNTYYLPKDGGRGSITSASTKNSNSGFSFTSAYSSQASFKLRSKNSNYTNDSDTGYYNFYTATLGYSYYNDGKTSGTSPQDICPKGWRMPRTTDSGTNVTAIDSTNDFTYLARTYGTSNWSGSPTGASGYNYYGTNGTLLASINQGAASPLATSTANNYAGFSYAGVYWDENTNTAGNVGVYGYYWSASVYGTGSGYYLFFGSSSVYPQYSGNGKYVGAAIRCIAK